jgi:2-aminoethylphosphonate-pyruvate transaminase
MKQLGFRLFLDESVQAPIIASFHYPTGRPFDFDAFYQALAARGFIIYPGKLSKAPSFRIGCIGAVEPADFHRLLAAIGGIMAESGRAD